MLVLFRLIVLAMAAAVVVMGQQPIPDDLATIRGFVKDHCENNTASFLGAHGPIETWNVSLVTDMNDLFDDADSLCNPDITQWDVSNVKDMTEMFQDQTAFDQSIGIWDVSSVETMRSMFSGAESFDQPIGDWDVGRVESMYSMFKEAKSFDQPIGDWDVRSVTSMGSMFNQAESFNQLIGKWDVSSVTDMFRQFYMAKAFNQPIGDWDVSLVEDFEEMFAEASAFNQPIGNWNVANAEDLTEMFSAAVAFNQYIGDWDTNKVIGKKGDDGFFNMFDGAYSYSKLLCWDLLEKDPSTIGHDNETSDVLQSELGLGCNYTTWNNCCDSVTEKETFFAGCVRPTCARTCRGKKARSFRSLSEQQVPDERFGNLRSRALNGWFDCGATHCVKGRSTCEIDAATSSRYCKCLDGYSGSECRPTDECETSFPCPGGSKCVDMFPPMMYKCVCESGYTPVLPDATTFDDSIIPIKNRPVQCLDKNECDAAVSPCHKDAACTNTIGGHECKCNEGLIGNGVTSCEEPPEEAATVTDGPPSGCITDEDCTGANMQCVETKCICIPGYAQVGPNCQNEVHCDVGGFNNDCHRRASCIEESGFPGFSCKCVEGWEDAFEGANGKSCKIIPGPETEAPPEPVSDAATTLAAGVGPHPNRPTVFCRADGASCASDGACCSGDCF